GHGRIGRRIGRLAAAFGMHIVAVDPRPGLPADGVAMLPLADALAAADAVVLAVPLTAGTHHLIDAAALTRMRPSAILVNVARGGVLDQAALADALAEGRLLGAGLDVLEREPPDHDDPLLARDDVVLSPHVAASTPEAVLAVAMACAGNVIAGLAGRLDPGSLVPPDG
ncbi:MAG: NAD(P)-dependent oxidoreductase, partial [Alphaproteobacteria bacterium]